MLIVMQKSATEAQIQAVIELIHSRGLSEHISKGAERTIIGAVGDERVFDIEEILMLEGVEKAVRVLNDWRIISRESQAEDSVITVRGIRFGDGHLHTVLALENGFRLPEGPNAVYLDPFHQPGTPYTADPVIADDEQLRLVREHIAQLHTNHHPVIARLRDVRQIESLLSAEADILYLGGEMMGNRALLEEVGHLNVPVIVCKDKHHRFDEWLMAAEHIAVKGNHLIMLGEAGTFSLEHNTPYRLDIESIVKAKELTHLPVIANLLRLPHTYMPESVLFNLAKAAGVDAVILPLRGG